MNYFYILLYSILLFVSCGKKSVENSIKTYYPLEMCQEYDGTSDVFDVELIPLQDDTLGNVLANIHKVLIVDDYLIVCDFDKVLCFAKDGKFIGKYGDKGHAANEYPYVHDIAVSMDNKALYVYTIDNVLCYDIQSREYQKTITPQYPSSSRSYMGFCVGTDDCFYFFNTYSSIKNNGETALPYIIKYDKDGKLLSEHLFWKNVVFGHNPITPTYNNRYFVKPQGEERICYEICRDSVSPIASFAIDFGDKNIPFRYGVTEESSEEHFQSDYFKHINTPIDNAAYVMFVAIGAKDIGYQFIINKNTDKGIYITSTRTGFITSDKDSFYALLPFEYGESAFEKKLKSKLPTTSEEHNYLLKIKFKF